MKYEIPTVVSDAITKINEAVKASPWDGPTRQKVQNHMTAKVWEAYKQNNGITPKDMGKVVDTGLVDSTVRLASGKNNQWIDIGNPAYPSGVLNAADFTAEELMRIPHKSNTSTGLHAAVESGALGSIKGGVTALQLSAAHDDCGVSALRLVSALSLSTEPHHIVELHDLWRTTPGLGKKATILPYGVPAIVVRAFERAKAAIEAGTIPKLLERDDHPIITTIWETYKRNPNITLGELDTILTADISTDTSYEVLECPTKARMLVRSLPSKHIFALEDDVRMDVPLSYSSDGLQITGRYKLAEKGPLPLEVEKESLHGISVDAVSIGFLMKCSWHPASVVNYEPFDSDLLSEFGEKGADIATKLNKVLWSGSNPQNHPPGKTMAEVGVVPLILGEVCSGCGNDVILYFEELAANLGITNINPVLKAMINRDPAELDKPAVGSKTDPVLRQQVMASMRAPVIIYEL